jgi:uncharacterized protein
MLGEDIRGRPNDGICGPIELVVLQGTSFCNLNCSYCYLSESSRRNRSSMSLSALELIFEKILSSRYVGEGLQVSWHSGEPLVLKPGYYAEAIDKILALRNVYLSSDFDIQFDIQTNGTLIDQTWCDLFKAYESVLSVGVSCDGPAVLHDAYRRTWAGKATHQQVMKGIELLRANGLRFDVIAVVSPDGLQYPEAFIEFFAKNRDSLREFHFNLYDEFDIGLADEDSLELYCRRYDGFIRSLLKAYASLHPLPRIRNFSAFYEMVLSEAETKTQFDARSMSRPLKALNVQAHGDVTTFYAGLTGNECRDLYEDGRGLVVGNLLQQNLDEIASSRKLLRIWQDFEVSHKACEAECQYYGVCSGGYNLVKHKRFGTFNATETPECRIHVKTFANAVLEELGRDVAVLSEGPAGA